MEANLKLNKTMIYGKEPNRQLVGGLLFSAIYLKLMIVMVRNTELLPKEF